MKVSTGFSLPASIVYIVIYIALILITQCQAKPVGNLSYGQATSTYSSLFGNLREEKTIKETTLADIMQKETILAMSNWDLDKKEYLCIVTYCQIKIQDKLVPNRKLGLFERNGDRLIKKYEYETGDWFLSLYPLKDSAGNLLTIWGGGVAYHFLIFSMVENKVHVVLEDGSYFLPDIIDIDGDGEQEILVTIGKFTTTRANQIIPPEGRRIYKWSEKEYILIGILPWMKIIDALPYRKKSKGLERKDGGRVEHRRSKFRLRTFSFQPFRPLGQSAGGQTCLLTLST